MPENLSGALSMAQQICWDETHGYTTEVNGISTGRQLNPDCDCSSFVCHCLYQNGFNIYEWGDTNTIINTLSNYPGFLHLIFDPNSTQLVHGDILVSEGYGASAHTFFYAENVVGYTGNTSATGILSRARIEASSDRGHHQAGDQDNGSGCHNEVWVHPYSFDTGDTRVWHLFRWLNGPGPGPGSLTFDQQIALYSSLNRRRKDESIRYKVFY